MLIFRALLKKSVNVTCRRTFHVSPFIQDSASVSDKVNKNGPKKKMDDYFIEKQVQMILLKITGFDLEKIFHPVKQKLMPSIYKFVTDKQLEEMREKAKRKAFTKLQMPPVMEMWDTKEEVMSYDPELQGYTESNQVFIDISPNVSDRERIVTVREPDGTLRKANHDERFRMNQIFFPKEGRNILIPKLFESLYLDGLLDEGSYIFILDSACAQFEPDDPEYHRVTNATYERINSKKAFDSVRSTRHFGPMSFYFAWNQKIERLLVDMIERAKIADASDLIKLLYILHPELTVEDIQTKNDLELVNDFIQKNSSQHKPDLELALQTYIERESGSAEKEMEETNVL